MQVLRSLTTVPRLLMPALHPLNNLPVQSSSHFLVALLPASSLGPSRCAQIRNSLSASHQRGNHQSFARLLPIQANVVGVSELPTQACVASAAVAGLIM